MVSQPADPEDKVVTLQVANFGDNVAIKSNDGNYSFSIASGTYIGKVFTGSSEADTITNAGSEIKIAGSAGDDLIINSGDNVTINGGEGDDSLWGGAGAETFIYQANEGTDTITNYNYADGDILRIFNADGMSGTYGNATFANDKLTLAIDGGGSVVFDGVSAGDSININNTTYEISNSELVKK